MLVMAIPILLLAACKKDAKPVVITDSLQSDPILKLAPLPCGAQGGASFYGTMTITGHVANVHGETINKTCSVTPEGNLAVTSDDVVYFDNGDQLWTKGNIVVIIPTDGSTTATITEVQKLLAEPVGLRVQKDILFMKIWSLT